MLHGEGLGYDYFSQKLKVTEHELGPRVHENWNIMLKIENVGEKKRIITWQEAYPTFLTYLFTCVFICSMIKEQLLRLAF